MSERKTVANWISEHFKNVPIRKRRDSFTPIFMQRSYEVAQHLGLWDAEIVEAVMERDEIYDDAGRPYGVRIFPDQKYANLVDQVLDSCGSIDLRIINLPVEEKEDDSR